MLLISAKKYEEFCEKILELDGKIRFAGIYDAPRVYGKMREGLTSYLSPFETETSLNQALYRWKARLKFQQKIGAPVFALTKYEKVFRVTMIFEGEKILCFSAESDVNIIDLINKVIELRNKTLKA